MKNSQGRVTNQFTETGPCSCTDPWYSQKEEAAEMPTNITKKNLLSSRMWNYYIYEGIQQYNYLFILNNINRREGNWLKASFTIEIE